MRNATKNLMSLLLAVTFVLVSVFAVTTVQAANSPYCRLSYDVTQNCVTVKYYSYDSTGTAQYDVTRLIKFGDGTIKTGTADTVVTTKHLSSGTTSWTAGGNFIVWIETDYCLYCRQYNGTTNTKIADKASSINLDSNSMVTTVTFSDGTTKTIASLLPATSGSGSGSDNGSGNNGGSDNSDSGSNDSGNSGGSSNGSGSSSSSSAALQEWTDSAGQEHYKFGSNEVIVDTPDIYINGYKVSQFCKSGVKFVGVDDSYRVYLYEDSTASFYRFKIASLFTPDKIKFATGTTINSVTTNSLGYMTAVVTSTGTFTIAQLVADTVWYPAVSYVINKSGYCEYYIAETDTVYTLRLENGVLYLNGSKVAKNITRKTESFGFAGTNIYYIKNNKMFRVPLSNISEKKVVKKNVKKLVYSSTDGTVVTAQ